MLTDPATVAAWLSVRRTQDPTMGVNGDRMLVVHRLVAARVPFTAADVAALAGLAPRAAANLVTNAHRVGFVRRVRRIGTQRRQTVGAFWFGASTPAPSGWEVEPAQLGATSRRRSC